MLMSLFEVQVCAVAPAAPATAGASEAPWTPPPGPKTLGRQIVRRPGLWAGALPRCCRPRRSRPVLVLRRPGGGGDPQDSVRRHGGPAPE